MADLPFKGFWPAGRGPLPPLPRTRSVRKSGGARPALPDRRHLSVAGRERVSERGRHSPNGCRPSTPGRRVSLGAVEHRVEEVHEPIEIAGLRLNELRDLGRRGGASETQQPIALLAQQSDVDRAGRAQV